MYCEITDLILWIDEGQLVELASQSDGATLISEPVILVLEKAIDSADSLIDSHCLNRWPALRSESPVPDEINKISARIAIYYLFERRAIMPETRRQAYEDCEKQLRLFADGKVSLGLDDSGSIAESAVREDVFRTDASDNFEVPEDDQRVFTADKLDKL